MLFYALRVFENLQDINLGVERMPAWRFETERKVLFFFRLGWLLYGRKSARNKHNNL